MSIFKFNDDGDAWDILTTFGWKHEKGHIKAPKPVYTPSAVEDAAIDYLCSEWDYSYTP